MRKNTDISKERLEQFIDDFYRYFNTGYEFEEFLKVYLEKIGLDEVQVTQRSKDGGIDLKAIRNGIGGFSDSDTVEYYVQAKKYKPSNTISVSKIRELKGTIPFGNKGVFITTAKFSSDAIKEASNDISKPVILIDGKQLILSCIDNELGFVFVPTFSPKAMDAIKEKVLDEQFKMDVGNISSSNITVVKNISTNDIRARILRIPKAILQKISSECGKMKIVFNGLPEKELKIDKTRTFLGGVTELYKECGLIDSDGTYNSKKAIWTLNGNNIFVDLE